MKKKWIFLASLLFSANLFAQNTVLKHNGWECNISNKGTLEQIVFKNVQHNDTIHFFKDKGYAGPSFYANLGKSDITAQWIPDGRNSFRATINDVECCLLYKEWKGEPAIEVTLENKGNVPFQPVKAGLKLGIDTYMDKYPDWFGKYFPTLMMNEKTHFYGYLQSPSGNMLAVVSPQPIASWSVDYNLGYQDPAPHWFMGHRIESMNLDLMNALPLPSHNPQNLWMLRQGETKRWIIAFININASDKFEEIVHKVASVPMIRMSQTAYQPGQRASFEVLAISPNVKVEDSNGKSIQVSVKNISQEISEVSCVLPEVGLYTVKVTDGDKCAEGVLSARSSWQWTMQQARKGAFKYKQKATSHIESWYGFYSSF
ncbi:MAG: hypothetical protein RR388_04095, partial [Rikenellaceae bacterium]